MHGVLGAIKSRADTFCSQVIEKYLMNQLSIYARLYNLYNLKKIVMDKDMYFWTYWKKKWSRHIQKIQWIIKHCHYNISCLLNKLVANVVFLIKSGTPILEPWRHLYICPESDRKSPHLKSSFVRNISAAGWMIKSKSILPTVSVALRWLLPCFCNKTMESVWFTAYLCLVQ